MLYYHFCPYNRYIEATRIYGTLQLKKLPFLTISINYLMQVGLIAMSPTFDCSVLFYKMWRILA